jgi:hypothetical protein
MGLDHPVANLLRRHPGVSLESHLDQTRLQHGHRRGEPDAARTLRQVARDSGEQGQLLGRRIVADDGGAETLQVVLIVEVVDQNVVLLDLSGADRGHDDSIGILVAVGRHRRCYDAVAP